MKKYQCQECGNIKDLLINHDGLPEVWERCTEACMWSSYGELGPALYSADMTKTGFRGETIVYREKTGFHKRKYKRIF